jgi:hypothetical protein
LGGVGGEKGKTLKKGIKDERLKQADMIKSSSPYINKVV